MRLTLILLLGLSHGTAQEIVTYGPWIGYWQQARLSAYSPHDALDRDYHETKGKWRWITADGKTDVRYSPYGIAAPSAWPFGTRIVIPVEVGYLAISRPGIHSRCFVVDDRGSAIERGYLSEKRLFLDLRFRTERSALAFGTKHLWVFIITGDSK